MAAALALVSGTVFAKSWTNNIGVGASIPSLQVKADVDGSEAVKMAGFAFDATYLGIAANGFAVKAVYDVGALSCEDVSVYDDTLVGTYTNFTFGAGFAPVNDDTWTVSVTGMLGFDFVSFEEDVGSVTRTTEAFTFSLGADLYASYKLKEHFGFYADLGIYYLPSGTTKVEVGSADFENDLKGKYRVSPTLGVCWKF